MTTLKDINPKVGAKVIIELARPKRKIALELLGFIQGKSILLSVPKKKASYASNKIEGSTAKIHIMLHDSICTFVSKVTHVLNDPFPCWNVAYPKDINVSKIRKDETVSIHLPVAIEAKDKSLDQHNEIPNIVLCNGLSLTGGYLESPLSLIGISQEYFITLRINITDIDQMLQVPIMLKSSKMVEQGVYVNEFEFQPLLDESKILIAAFIYKKILVEHGHIND
jgi:hypothetical protein